ncbi:MAG TPA: ester cyclase [Chitinophagaceae bacterium]|nr:ester cyclase [Chitinophagaceae bacterium]
METTTSKKVSLQETRENFKAYFESHDVQYVAEDAVFINMGTGEETRGREAIGAMLHYIYHVAFDARAETISYLVTEDRAMLEGYFVGRHIGEFAGIPATNKEVRVPLCVTYQLENGLIKSGRVYMLGDVMMRQLTQ